MAYKISITAYFRDGKALYATVHTEAVPRVGEFIDYDGDTFLVERVIWDMGEYKATSVRIFAYQTR